jgi:3-hydroxyisobutyrate dehydrogenase
MTEKTTVAFLGLGAMGSRMAARLLDAGTTVRVYNRSRGPRDALAARGAVAFATPAQAVAGADVVMAMVTDDEAARAVWLHPETGALAGLAEGATCVESSTVTPGWIAELRGALSADHLLLDAPVAGSRPQAEAGQLTYLVGGPAEALERVRPLLAHLGGAIHHVGAAPGAGAVMKLVVNGMFGVQIAALSELLGLAEAGGVGVERALSVLGETPILSPAMKGVGRLIRAGTYAPMFPVDLVEKDFRYVVETAGRAPVAEATRGVFRAAQAEGFGEENLHAVAKLYLTH